MEKAPSSLLLNAGVGISVVSFICLTDNAGLSVWLWLTALMVTLALRFGMNVWIDRCGLSLQQPVKSLHWLAYGAFLTGLVWGALPMCLGNNVNHSVFAGVYLMMLGVSAGSALRSIEYSLISTCFSLPTHIGATIPLFSYGDTPGMILAVNVALMSLIFYRGGRTSEKTYIESLTTNLQATSLAQSLTAANSDILKANARLADLANKDSLTGLANRAAFNTRLAEGIRRAEEQDGQLALLILDLDRFKTVNDTLGHRGGDELLQQFAQRLRITLHGQNIVARLGGDEFAVIISGKDAVARAQRETALILEQSSEPFNLRGQGCIVGTSIGLAVYPDHGRDAEELFVSADMALYSSKERGRGSCTEFDPQMRAAAARQRQIEGDILQAIESGEVQGWFQPQVSLSDNTILGFEALVRWHHPQLGPISPPDIVQAAHNIQSSEKLTQSIAEAACRLLTQLPAMGLPQATVAINVSPREFAMYSVADMLDKVATRHGIRRSLLEIEITEETLLDTDIAMEQLKQLETSGFMLAVDDFGAGHSSLTHLIDLKVDRLKIDRGLTTGIHRTPRNQAIIAALISLGEALSMSVLAEGVETEAEAETLRTLGCEIGQGYLFSRALRADQLETWVNEWTYRDDAEYAVA